jgi:hypothetical protein
MSDHFDSKLTRDAIHTSTCVFGLTQLVGAVLCSTFLFGRSFADFNGLLLLLLILSV